MALPSRARGIPRALPPLDTFATTKFLLVQSTLTTLSAAWNWPRRHRLFHTAVRDTRWSPRDVRAPKQASIGAEWGGASQAGRIPAGRRCGFGICPGPQARQGMSCKARSRSPCHLGFPTFVLFSTLASPNKNCGSAWNHGKRA